MSRRRKIFIVVGIILGVAVLIPVIRHYQLRFEVESYIAELKAKGERMELVQVVPLPVPTNQNSASLFLKAVSLFNTNETVLNTNQPPTVRMVAAGKAMVGWQRPDVCEYVHEATNSWQEIDFALAKESGALDLLRQLPEDAAFDFQLNFSNGFSKVKFSPLASAKRAALKLEADISSSLHRSDSATAVKDIESMLSVTHGISHDSILISELVRIAIAQITLAANWELLQSTNLTDEQLAGLQDHWSRLEFIHAYERAVALERAVGKIEVANMRDTSLQCYFGSFKNIGLIDTDKGIFAGLKIRSQSALWRYWWSYPDELRYLQGLQTVIEASRQAKTNFSLFAANKWVNNRFEELGIKPDDDEGFWFVDPAKANFHYIISSSVMAFKSAFTKLAKVEASRQMIMTAIALKRFQLKHGYYPENISELTPEFLPTIPLDPVDGQPLRYRRNADGLFMLYSVGANGVDDGGDPSLEKNVTSSNYYWQNDHALDWVWPQPATAEEIKNYYTHPPK